MTADEELSAVESLRRDSSPLNPAFDRIYQAYQQRLRGFVRMRTNSDREVEDILSETWLKFWRSIPKAQVAPNTCQYAGISAFLYQIALNTLLDHYRKTVRGSGKIVVLMDDLQAIRNAISSGDGQDTLEFPAQSASPEELFADCEVKEFMLQTAFAKTGRPAHEVVVFGLAVCLGFKPQELASARMMSRPLRLLHQDLEAGMREGSQLPEARLAAILDPLKKSLAQSASRVRELLRAPSRVPTVGDSTLHEYASHPASPAKDIRVWRYNVLRRTILIATNRAAGRSSK